MKCDCTRLWKNFMAPEWKIRTKFALKFCREVTFLAPLVAEIRPTVETCWAVGAAAQHLCSTEQTSRHPQQKYQLFCNKTHCHAIKKDLTAFCCQSNEYWLSKVMMLLLKILAKKKKNRDTFIQLLPSCGFGEFYSCNNKTLLIRCLLKQKEPN